MKRKKLSREMRGIIFHGILVAILLTVLILTAVSEGRAIVIPEEEISELESAL
ncbi:MAG: hypothetical protein MJ141_09205 [Clostridia bacterium]|nr:hypothetical protein [Clostridia bacterium]